MLMITIKALSLKLLLNFLKKYYQQKLMNK